ncbi:MAG: T9SS type A sorting domain-containing protein [Bacteroidia bacterium]|nr:T9SS type A sorting domain-containing protein [Bacteroidia bacterium]
MEFWCNGIQYTWNNGISNNIPFQATTSTTYTVTVTDDNGCTDTDDLFINVYPLPTAFAGNDQVLCHGDSTFLNATGGLIYQWNNGVNNNQYFSPQSTTTYTVTVTDNNGCIDTDDVVISVNSIPSTPSIVQIGNDLVSSSISGNQWYLNNDIIQGETDQTYTPVQNGDYFVIINQNGCFSDTSNLLTVTWVGISDLTNNLRLKIYPNPVKNNISIISYDNNIKKVELIDILGNVLLVYKTHLDIQKTVNINIDEVPNGMYFIRLNTTDEIVIQKIIKE